MNYFLRGAFIAPVCTCVVFYVGVFVYQLANGKLGNDLSEWLLTGPVMVFGWGLIIAYPVMFLFGLPYVYWLRSRNKLLLKYVCAGAFFGGAVLSFLLISVLEGRMTLSIIAIFSALSLMTAFIFCKIEGINNELNERFK